MYSLLKSKKTSIFTIIVLFIVSILIGISFFILNFFESKKIENVDNTNKILVSKENEEFVNRIPIADNVSNKIDNLIPNSLDEIYENKDVNIDVAKSKDASILYLAKIFNVATSSSLNKASTINKNDDFSLNKSDKNSKENADKMQKLYYCLENNNGAYTLRIRNDEKENYNEFDTDKLPPWFTDEDIRFRIIKVAIENSITPISVKAWFGCINEEQSGSVLLSNIKYFEGLSNLHLPKDASFLFCGCNLVESVDSLPSDIGNINNAFSMFSLSNFSEDFLNSFILNLFSANNLGWAFNDCKNLSLAKFPISNQLINATNLSYTFLRDTGLKEVVNLPSQAFHATTTSCMFYGCENLCFLNISSFITSSVENVSGMFAKCGFTTLDISGWDVSNVSDISHLFEGNVELEKILAAPTTNWDNIAKSVDIFKDCSNLLGGNGTKYSESLASQNGKMAKTDCDIPFKEGEQTPNYGFFTSMYTPTVPTTTISYDKNGGSWRAVDPYKQVVSKGGYFTVQGSTADNGANVILDPIPPNNNEFLGWATTNDAKEAEYKAGDSVSTDKEQITLFAVYADPAETFVVNFCDGSNTILFSQTVVKNQYAIRPDINPDKDGYYFDDWYTTAAGSSKFNFNTRKIIGNTNIYAKFINKFKMVYLRQEGSSSDVEKDLVIFYSEKSYGELHEEKKSRIIEGSEKSLVYDAERYQNWGYYKDANDIYSIEIDPSVKECVDKNGKGLLKSTLGMFQGTTGSSPRYFKNITNIWGLDNLITDSVINMSSMFQNCTELIDLDLSFFNTKNVKNTSSMFNGCSNLKTIYVSEYSYWSENITTSSGMFTNCTNIVGGNGTKYNSSYVMAAYARADRYASPGYFTYKGDDACNLMYNFNYPEGGSEPESFVQQVKYDTNETNMFTIGGAGSQIKIDSKHVGPDDEYTFRGWALDKDSKDSVGYTNDAYFPSDFSKESPCVILYAIWDPTPAKTPRVFKGHFTTSSNDVNATNDTLIFAYIDKDTVYDKGSTFKLTETEQEFYLDTAEFYIADTYTKAPLWAGSQPKKAIIDKSFEEYYPYSTAYWFAKSMSISSIDNVNYINTEKVNNMKYMFNDCVSLERLDLSSFKTPYLKDMSHMFQMGNDKAQSATNNLKYLDISNFNTSLVTDMSFTFRNCSTLEEIKLPPAPSELNSNLNGEYKAVFSTAQAVTLSSTFYGLNALTSDVLNVYLRSFDTRNVRMMNDIFNKCRNLTSIDLSNWSFANCETMRSMFKQCYSLTEVIFPDDITKFNTQNVGLATDENGKGGLINLFGFCVNLKTTDYILIDARNNTYEGIKNFNHLKTNNATDMSYMFCECRNLELADLSNFDTSKCTSIKNMFGVGNEDSSIETEKEDLIKFYESKGSEPPIQQSKLKTVYASSKWNTSNVKVPANSEFCFDFNEVYNEGIVGGNGFKYSSTYATDKTYAILDNNGQNGYFTYKPAYDDIKDSCSLTYNLNYEGSTPISFMQTVRQGQSFTVGGEGNQVIDPTRSGYTFDGWYTNPECVGMKYSIADILPASFNSSIVLYAKWIATSNNFHKNNNNNVDNKNQDVLIPDINHKRFVPKLKKLHF